MDRDDIPEVFWEVLQSLSFDDEPDLLSWHPALPAGLTDVLEVASPGITLGRTVHLVGDPASTTVAYTHVIVQHGRLGMRVYFPANPVPGAVGIPAYIVGFRDLPQVRRMYELERVLARLPEVTDIRSAYGRAVAAATVQQAVRALAGLATFDHMPFTLLPVAAA